MRSSHSRQSGITAASTTILKKLIRSGGKSSNNDLRSSGAFMDPTLRGSDVVRKSMPSESGKRPPTGGIFMDMS